MCINSFFSVSLFASDFLFVFLEYTQLFLTLCIRRHWATQVNELRRVSEWASIAWALTYERQGVSRAGQHVVGVEQKEGVAQDEGRLEVGARGAFGRKQEAEEVQRDEEAAGDQQVDHVDGGMASKRDLGQRQETFISVTPLSFRFQLTCNRESTNGGGGGTRHVN